MANTGLRVAENVAGDFFVDSTCIDCDTCRQIAPGIFAEAVGHSFVRAQPTSEEDLREGMRALVCCPTGSIGTQGKNSSKTVMSDFPLLIEDPVYYCGFNSPKSFGGNSYFIRHPEGNWLIDSPKFLPQLVRQFEATGGISKIFLTHRDDVADAEQYAQRFGSTRFIHQKELAAQPTAEVVIEGNEIVELAPGLMAVPTPGHTAGHCCLLFQDRFLFTGDHLYFDRHQQCLSAYRDYCWDSWSQQIESMKRLTRQRFEWVLPGHGQRVHLPETQLQQQLVELIGTMQV